MFLVVQHPFADLRAFCPEAEGRVARPAWPLATPCVDFIRSSGSVQARRRGGVPEWEGEENYCDASAALRFPDSLNHLARGTTAFPAHCNYSFRRFYSQGKAARLEVGMRLASDEDDTVARPDHRREALFAWLGLEVSVGPHRHRKSGLKLVEAGPALAGHYLRASTLRTKEDPAQPPLPGWCFQARTPALVIEAPMDDTVSLPRHARALRLPAELGSLHHAWLQLGPRRVSAWFLHSADRQAPQLRALRIHLLRLHSERETLHALLAAVVSNKLDITSDSARSDAVQHYLNETLRATQRPARHGVQQAEMVDIACDAFNELPENSTATLDTLRRQIGDKVRAYLKRSSEHASTVTHITNLGTYMNTTIKLGSVTVGGDFNLVTAKNIENSFNKAASAGTPELADKLKALSVQVAELAKKLPADQAEKASRDLETLTSEATSEEPRKEWFELSGKGLIEAAKTVAEMAAPVATAVKAVLALLAV